MDYVNYFLVPLSTMTKNTTVMVWYIAMLTIAGAFLWSGGNSADLSYASNAFSARNSTAFAETRSLYPQDPSSARLIVNGIEYEATLTRVPNYTY